MVYKILSAVNFQEIRQPTPEIIHCGARSKATLILNYYINNITYRIYNYSINNMFIMLYQLDDMHF